MDNNQALVTMEDLYKKVFEVDKCYHFPELKQLIFLLMSEWASIQCAEKDTSYQRLTEQFQLLADKVIKKGKEIATKEEAIKELVQGLEWIEEKTRFNCYTDVDVAEINQRAEQLIQKHKV